MQCDSAASSPDKVCGMSTNNQYSFTICHHV
jgi:hypothetical protein